MLPVGPVAPVAPTPVGPVAPVGPVPPVDPVPPVGPIAPSCPTMENAHDDPEPAALFASAVSTSVVPENDVIKPSMNAVGEPVSVTRARSPTAKAVRVFARFVVNVLDPVPNVTVLLEVNPA